jgi:predicted PurR-regulated permease PerM
MGTALQWWRLGQVLGMVFIGILVGVGLRLLGMPLAATLGIFAGLMAFIPNIGYFLSIAPAILLAVLQSPLAPLYVLILYTGAHWGNDYVITPLVQKRTVHLLPALTITMQLLLGF